MPTICLLSAVYIVYIVWGISLPFTISKKTDVKKAKN